MVLSLVILCQEISAKTLARGVPRAGDKGGAAAAVMEEDEYKCAAEGW